jgi:hypothetical protein
MYARFRARRRRRPAIAALGVGLVLVLGACDTQPATDVTYDAATLNAKGACAAGMSGSWQYQLRRPSGAFSNVGPSFPFSCGSNSGEVALQSHRVGGLAPGTLYQFRIVSRLSNGQVLTFDRNGTNGGTAYDQFRTLAPQVTWQSGNMFNNDTSDDPGIPNPHGDETGAEASSVKRCKGRHRPLQNLKFYAIFAPPVYSDRLYEAGTETKWCWYSGPYGYGRIYWREHSPVRRPLQRLGSVNLSWRTYSSVCTAGSTNCLHRAELHAAIGIIIGDFQLAKNNYHCVGTRIYSGGNHSRNIHDSTCAAAGAARAPSPDEGLEFGGGLDVPASLERQVDRACFTRRNLVHYKEAGKVLPRCARVARRAYDQATG